VRYEEPFRSMEWNGQTVCLYRDIQRLQRHFDEVSPADAAMTRRLVSDVRALSNMEMPIIDIKGVQAAHPQKMSLGALLKMLPAFPKMAKLSKLSAGEYAANFQHPALRWLLGNVVTEEYSASSLVFTLATLAAGDGGYPEGGSLALTKRMADRFRSLGGELLLGAKADKVVAHDGVLAGVMVGDELLPAAAVIITQETLAAVEQLFDTPPQDQWLAQLRRNTKPAVCCFVGVGIAAQLAETPAFELPQPIQCGGFSYPVLAMCNYSKYPEYAPAGGTTLTTAFTGDSYDFWLAARADGRYAAEKQAVAEQVSRALTEKYPQIAGKIQVVDVATPLTYERYTGASRGSWMSVMGKGDSNPVTYPCTLESTPGIYFAGHRTMPPGGLPVALMSGRKAAQLACRQFDMVFQ